MTNYILIVLHGVWALACFLATIDFVTENRALHAVLGISLMALSISTAIALAGAA